jgi:hypothetical protein
LAHKLILPDPLDAYLIRMSEMQRNALDLDGHMLLSL